MIILLTTTILSVENDNSSDTFLSTFLTSHIHSPPGTFLRLYYDSGNDDNENNKVQNDKNNGNNTYGSNGNTE